MLESITKRMARLVLRPKSRFANGAKSSVNCFSFWPFICWMDSVYDRFCKQRMTGTVCLLFG